MKCRAKIFVARPRGLAVAGGTPVPIQRGKNHSRVIVDPRTR
jgi:hypothetical protein